MFVTNLTSSRLGIDGTTILEPNEVNRFVNDGDPTVAIRAFKLQEAGLISVIKGSGITKTDIPGKVVKLLGVDEAGITKKPRTSKRKPKEEPVAEEAAK